MMDPTIQSIIIHFKDGRIETGLFHSRFLDGKVLRYIPQSLITDRRRAARIPFVREVTIDQLGVRRGVDLSSQGMYVEHLAPYPIGTILPITLRLDGQIIHLDARVVFQDPGIGMGLEFVRLRSLSRSKLETLIRYALNSKDTSPPQDRRARDDRRTDPHTNHKKQLGRDLRNRSRRRQPNALPRDPVEVEFFRLKAIFFLDQNGGPGLSGGVPNPSRKEVIVTFRDGEEIRGIMTEISPENMGFFMDMHVSEKISHTVYVVKAAVEKIVHL